MADKSEEIREQKKREEFTKENKAFLTETNKKDSERNEILTKIKEQLANESVTGSKKLKELLESQTNKEKRDRFTDEQKKSLTDQFSLSQFGLGDSDAAQRVAARDELELLNKEKERLEGVQKEFGLSGTDETELKALEADIQSLQEVMKFGRTLTKFEKNFQTFAGGTMDELIASTKNSGALTAEGVAKGFGNDLKGDFDKVLSFLGPAAGFLQQIPLLGTIANLAKAGFKRMFVEFFLNRKSATKDAKKIVNQEIKSSKILKADMAADARERRREARERMKNRLSGGKGGGEGDTIIEGDVEKDNKFGQFLGAGFAMQALKGGAAGGGFLAMLAAGFSAIGKVAGHFMLGAASLAGAIVLLGGAVALSIAAVLGSIALGFKPWDTFNTPEILERISSDKIKPGKITALIAGLGAASVLTAIGGLAQTIATLGGTFTPMTDLAKDLGGFADNIGPFSELDFSRISKNYAILRKDILSESGGLWENFKMWTGNDKFENFGEDLGEFASKIKPFIDLDMVLFVENMSLLNTALNNMDFPKWGTKERNTMSALQRFGNIKLAEDFGDEIIKLGTGIGMISSGIETLTLEKANALGALGREIGQNFDNFNLNFGVVPQTAGSGANLNVDGGVNGMAVLQPIYNSSQTHNTTNVAHQFVAQGANMNGENSALT